MATRHGYLARWHGTEYDASPGPDGHVRLYRSEPAEGFDPLPDGRHRRIVPGSDLEALRYVRTVCAWRGAPFVVVGEQGSWLRVEYLGEDAAVARQLGLDYFDVGVFQGWAPRAEVTELREELT